MSVYSEYSDIQKAGVWAATLTGLGLLTKEGREGFKEGGLSGGLGKSFGIGTKAVVSVPLDFLKGIGSAFGFEPGGVTLPDMEKLKGFGLGAFAPTPSSEVSAAPSTPAWLFPAAIAAAALVVVLLIAR